jgi:hypothetical protein
LLAPPDVDRQDARAFAEHFADTLVARPALVLLLAAVHAVLEPGLDPASALAFKEVLGQALTEADGAGAGADPDVGGGRTNGGSAGVVDRAVVAGERAASAGRSAGLDADDVRAVAEEGVGRGGVAVTDPWSVIS